MNVTKILIDVFAKGSWLSVDSSGLLVAKDTMCGPHIYRPEHLRQCLTHKR